MAESKIKVDKDYIRTADAILKIIEMVLSLIVFICGCVWGYAYAGGWLQFAGMFAFLVVLTLFILRLLSVVLLVPTSVPWFLIEVIICLIFAAFFLICGIVAATRFYFSALAAATIFSFLDMIAFLINAFFLFRVWKSSGPSDTGTTSGGTTTQTSRSTHTSGGVTTTTTVTAERTSYP